MRSIRVLLADDHGLFRDGVASLLSAWDVEVVGQASDGMEAVEKALALRPDLVLMDIRMPRLGGLEATRMIKEALPDTKIVMVTVSDEDHDLLQAVKSGAEGYLLKNMSGTEFGEMLAGLTRGVPPISPSLAGRLLREFARQARGGSTSRPADDLTDREREVLRLVAQGQTNREVAKRLVISENTVSFHMKNILGKLHVRNRAEAAVRALREGLTEPPRGH